ncbi:MAG TPA: hypothetical protein VGH10_09190 [Actinomycetota bacterium]|jgi:hypothetical protein
MIDSGWKVTFEEGTSISEASTGGTIVLHVAGLAHRTDQGSRLYPWHRIREIEWESAESGRSALAQGAGLSEAEDPFDMAPGDAAG